MRAFFLSILHSCFAICALRALYYIPFVNEHLPYSIILFTVVAVLFTILRMKKHYHTYKTVYETTPGYEMDANGKKFVKTGAYTLLNTKTENGCTVRTYSGPNNLIFATKQNEAERRSRRELKFSFWALLCSILIPVAGTLLFGSVLIEGLESLIDYVF